jgi:hypothetical protein
MQTTNLTLIVFELIEAIDSGKFDDIKPQEIESHIESGDIFSFIETKLGHQLKIGFVTQTDIEETTDALQRLDIAYGPSGFGIKNKGLCLLLAYINELIQHAHINDNQHLEL